MGKYSVIWKGPLQKDKVYENIQTSLDLQDNFEINLQRITKRNDQGPRECGGREGPDPH